MRIKNKKWLFLCSFILLFCAASFSFFHLSANKDRQRVFDYAELLKDSEIQKLEAECLKAEEEIKTELYILTTEDTEGKTSEDYADSFGDEHKFGYNKEYGDYIILLLDMQSRMIRISTSGKAIDSINKERREKFFDTVSKDLSKGDYNKVCLTYIQMMKKYMKTSPKNDGIGKSLLIYLGIAIVIGGGVTGGMYWQSSTQRTARGSDYAIQGKFHINQKADTYIRTAVKTRKIEEEKKEKDEEHHISSGGQEHGGGGRSF